MKSWKRHVRDLSGASVASAAATATDGVVYVFLSWTLVASGSLTVELAAGLGAVVGGVIHYALSRFWVFQRFGAPLKQSATAYFAMSWLAAAFHGVLTGQLVEILGPSLGWFASKGVIWLAWTFPVSRWIVFGGLGAEEAAAKVAERE